MKNKKITIPEQNVLDAILENISIYVLPVSTIINNQKTKAKKI